MSTVIEAPRAPRSARVARRASAIWYGSALAVVVTGVVLAVLWGMKNPDQADQQAVPPVLGALSLLLVCMVIAATIVFVALLRRAQDVE